MHVWLHVHTLRSSICPFGSNLLFTLLKWHFRHWWMNEFSSWPCWDVFKCRMSTSISYTVFILSSLLWSLFMVEWLAAFGKPKSLSAHPWFLLTISLSSQATAILWPKEKVRTLCVPRLNCDIWTAVFANPFSSPHPSRHLWWQNKTK